MSPPIKARVPVPPNQMNTCIATERAVRLMSLFKSVAASRQTLLSAQGRCITTIRFGTNSSMDRPTSRNRFGGFSTEAPWRLQGLKPVRVELSTKWATQGMTHIYFGYLDSRLRSRKFCGDNADVHWSIFPSFDHRKRWNHDSQYLLL